MTDPERFRRRDVFVSLFVLGLWLVPITEGALNAAPGRYWPGLIRDFGSVSCLFRSRPDTVRYFRVQVRRGPEWTVLDEREFFPMHPFGHRSRFDRFMERWGGRLDKSRADLARWIVARDRQLRPTAPPIVAVRFLAGNHPIRLDDPPPGHWVKPPLDLRRERVLSTHESPAEAAP